MLSEEIVQHRITIESTATVLQYEIYTPIVERSDQTTVDMHKHSELYKMTGFQFKYRIVSYQLQDKIVQWI